MSVSKQHSNREEQVVVLMIPNREGWYSLVVKKSSALLREITSKNNPDFCLNCLHSFHIRVCENKDFCNVVLPSEDTKILEFSQYPKSGKTPFIFYADFVSLIEKIDGCKKKP